METGAINSYDLVPYFSQPFSQTHPDRLAVIGTLLGMKPALADKCRVLELGCAAGGNLIPLAYAYPGSSFFGIDLSSVQIEEGRDTIRALTLANIELRQQSILDMGPEIGSFDFIICHGVYSWVPPPVQKKILDICRTHLQPQGIAYVSYNTYPGWHHRGMIRDMLFYHAKQFVEPAMRVKQARNLLDFLAKASAHDQGPYGLLLRQELEAFRRSSDAYLFHEHLEEHNEPLYFHQFVERATAAGLRYLGEADLRVMVPGNYPPEIENVLQMLAQDNIHLEQYMDFLRNRMFRQTLLCHKNMTVNYALSGERLRGFCFGSPARLQDGEAAPSEPRPSGSGAVATTPLPHGRGSDMEPVPEEMVRNEEPLSFEGGGGVTLQARQPLAKAAMTALVEAWPRLLSFADLLTSVRAKLHSTATLEADAQALGSVLLTFYAQASTSLLELWRHPPVFAHQTGDRPRASGLARLQAETRGMVTNLRQETVNLGEFERRLLMLVDGTRDRAALCRAIGLLVEQGALTVSQGGQNVIGEPELSETVAQGIDLQLSDFARQALLEN